MIGIRRTKRGEAPQGVAHRHQSPIVFHYAFFVGSR